MAVPMTDRLGALKQQVEYVVLYNLATTVHKLARQ